MRQRRPLRLRAPRRAVIRPVPGWLTRLAFGFVLFSLAALVLVPIWTERRVEEERREIEAVLEPARRLVAILQSAIAREVSATRGFVLTGDDSFVALFREARAVEEETLDRLYPLLRRVGPAETARLDSVQVLVSRWRVWQDQFVFGTISAAEYLRALPAQHRLYVAILAEADRLEATLARAAEERLAEIRKAERQDLVITLLLVLTALLSALVVAWFARRQRLLIEETGRRAREEAALREAAEAVTATFTVEETIERIAKSAVRATNADGTALEWVDDGRGEVEVAAVAGEITLPLHSRLAYAGSLAELVIERGEPEVVADLASAERIPAHWLETCAHCSALAIPLVDVGAKIGALILLRRPGKGVFHPDEVDRARTFGELAALAVRKVRLLEESERSRRELARVMESRSHLMRGFGHDVKNPLGAADGFLQLLEQGIPGPLDEQQKESVVRSRRAIGAALRLIDDLLEFARAEAGEIEIERRPVDVREVALEMAEEHRASAEAKGLAMRVRVPDALPVVETDPARVRQVLGNLLSNAIKYTRTGGITVRAEAREDGGAPRPGRWVAVSVSDTGPGIPEEKRGLLFQEFVRLEPEAEQGAGIGIAISERIARALGGAITVESEVGKGSTFTLWLPLRPRGEAPRPERSPGEG